jgi:hypothetical protein
MRLMDIMLALPSLLLAVAIVAILGPGLINTIFAIAIVSLPSYVRLTRAAVMGELNRDYVTAAQLAGASLPRLMFFTVLPNCMAPLIVQGTYICASAILVEAILSFLGVGLPHDIPTWGSVMAEGRAQFNEFPHNIFSQVVTGIRINRSVIFYDQDTFEQKLPGCGWDEFRSFHDELKVVTIRDESGAPLELLPVLDQSRPERFGEILQAFWVSIAATFPSASGLRPCRPTGPHPAACSADNGDARPGPINSHELRSLGEQGQRAHAAGSHKR